LIYLAGRSQAGFLETGLFRRKNIFSYCENFITQPTTKQSTNEVIPWPKIKCRITAMTRNEGHVDTREANFECENKDKNLGCDPGIDVAG
jgi:hypothetical protein